MFSFAFSLFVFVISATLFLCGYDFINSFPFQKIYEQIHSQFTVVTSDLHYSYGILFLPLMPPPSWFGLTSWFIAIA